MVRTRRRPATGVFCAFIATAIFASASFGAATLVEDNREINVLLDAYDFGGSNLQNPPAVLANFGDAFSDFDNLLGDSPNAAAEGGASANQVSDFDNSPSPVFSSYRASGSVTGNGLVITMPDTSGVQANAESNGSIVFSLSEPHDYTLSGGLQASPGNKTYVEATLSEFGGSDIYSLTSNGPIDSMGTLNPGTYELTLEASIAALTANNFGVFDLDASFNSVLFEITPVPEPATVGLFALGGAALVLGRRRRQ